MQGPGTVSNILLGLWGMSQDITLNTGSEERSILGSVLSQDCVGEI